MSGIGEALLISAAASLVNAGLTYALTPTQKIEGSRLDSLTSGNSSYGSPLPWAWGTVRLPGNKIWLDYLEERKKTESQGGGFFGLAPKVETTTYNYFGYWAEVYCECPFRPVASLQRNWMNKKLVYSTIGGAETIAKGGKFAEQYLRFYKGDPAQELDILLANKDSISSYSYGLPKNPSERDAFLRSFGIDPNTAILTPAYNYRALSVWQRVPLGDFFNAIPAGEAELLASLNCTVAQIVGDIFSLFYKPERYDVSLLTTPVKGFTIDSINAAKSAIQTLQQAYFFDIVDSNGVYKFIPLNHPRDVIHLGIKDLAAHTGEQKPVDYEIIESDPASLPSKVTVKYIDPDLNYDTNQQDSQLEVKGHYNPNPTNLSFNLVLTASEAATIADRALILAWISKYTYKFQLPPAYLNLEPADLIANVFDDRDVPIKLTKLRLGANLIIDAEGVGHDPFFWNLVRQLEAGGVTLGVADYNVILQVSGTPTTVSDSAGTIYVEGTDYTVTSEGNVQILSGGNIPTGTQIIVATATAPEPDPIAQGTIVDAGPTELLVLDIPLIKNSDSDYTLYLTGGGGENWNGASIYFSSDNSRYSFGGTLNGQGVYGECTSTLNDTVTVEVNSPELESITDADLGNGLNLALVGNEIIQFKTANLGGRNIYTLKQITRGLRGTENERDNHNVGDRFVLLTGDAAELTRIIGQATDIGEVRYFKAISSGQSLDEVEPLTLTVQGIAQRPYAPVNLRATKNGVGDIFIEWDRRDRHDQRENPPTMSEDEEKYLISVVNAQAVIRSYSSNKNSTIYTADHQTADFGSIRSTITVRVTQVSSDVGNGSFVTATLTPRLVEPGPSVRGFTPASGLAGSTITVTGTDLASVTEVRIGDIVQNNLAVIDNQTIEFTIAPGTASGNIELTTGGGGATSNGALIVETETTTPGHYLANDTEVLPQQPNLKFTGNVSVTDDETAEATIVEILAPTTATPDTFDELSITTQTLNDGEFEDLDLELPAVTALRQIDVSSDCRIRLFGSESARTDDTADINIQLQDTSGLILDKLISGSYQFARGIIAQNCDDPVADFIYARIGNNSGTNTAIDVRFKYYAIAQVDNKRFR